MNARSLLCSIGIASLLGAGAHGQPATEPGAPQAVPGVPALAAPVAQMLAAVVQSEAQEIVLRLEADAALTYDIFELASPHRVVVDLVGVRAPIAVTRPADLAGLVDVRWSLWKVSVTEPIVRYVLETRSAPTLAVEPDGQRLTVRVKLAPFADPGPPAPAEAPAAAPVAAPATAPEGGLPPTPVPETVPGPAPSRAEALDLGPIMVPFAPERASFEEPAGEFARLTDLCRAAATPAPDPSLWVWSSSPAEEGCLELWDAALMLPAAAPVAEAPAEPAPEPAPLVLVAPEPAPLVLVAEEPAPLVLVAEEPAPLVLVAPEPAAEPAPLVVEAPVAEDASVLPAAEPVRPEELVAMTDLPGSSDDPGLGEPVAAAAPSAPTAPERMDPFQVLIERHREAAMARAQRDWAQNWSPHDDAPQIGRGDADFVGAGRGRSAPMSLDVQGAEVHTVLRSIAEYAGVNVVADRDVNGILTLRALDLPWPEMLQTVCRAMGLVAIDHGQVIRVATERIAQEEAVARESAARKQEDFMPLQTRILHLRYAQAEELKDVITAMRSARGQVEVDPRVNALVVTDIEPRLELLERTLHELDAQTMQVEITAEIVDVDYTDARQLGITWGINNMHSSAANASGNLQVSSSALLDPAGEVTFGVVRSFGEIQARIQALVTENKADIISTPRITTVNNRLARILVGKEVPLITMDDAGNAITELKKVGITLEVTPYVNSEDQITLDLHPEVSDLSSQSTVQGGVVFTTTEADTRVMVREGETAVIGGLIRTLEGDLERGVPLLKDVPLLGQFFKHTERREEKRELLIFVTPRLVRAAPAQR